MVMKKTVVVRIVIAIWWWWWENDVEDGDGQGSGRSAGLYGTCGEEGYGVGDKDGYDDIAVISVIITQQYVGDNA